MSRASDLLRKFLDENNMSSTDFGAKLGVSARTVDRWLAGMAPKSHGTRIAVRNETRGAVPIEAWEEPQETKAKHGGKR